MFVKLYNICNSPAAEEGWKERSITTLTTSSGKKWRRVCHHRLRPIIISECPAFTNWKLWVASQSVYFIFFPSITSSIARGEIRTRFCIPSKLMTTYVFQMRNTNER